MTVELRGGLIVSTDALRLAISLEFAGHVLTAQEGKLLVSSGATLSAEERAAITAHKLTLLALCCYEASV